MDFTHLPPQLSALLQSPEAQQLIHHLEENGGSSFQHAAYLAQKGDEAAAKAAIAPLLQDPNTAALLQRLISQRGE